MLLKSKSLLLLAICLLATACAKEKLVIDGERIPVLEKKKVASLDVSLKDVEIILPQTTLNNSWSVVGGNPTHNMGHLHSNDNPQKSWEASFGDGDSKRDFLIATPIIASNKVFAIDANAKVSAFDEATGKLLWQKQIKAKNESDKESSLKAAGLAYYANNIYVTTGFGGVFALKADTGETIWELYNKTPIRIAPIGGDGKIFVQTIDNNVVAINAYNGKEVWRYSSSVEGTTLVNGGAPAYSSELDVLVVGLNNGEIRALKASTGSPLWSDYLISMDTNKLMSNINTIHANPIINNEVLYAASNNNLLVAINLRTGARIWEKEINVISQPYVAGNYMFLLANQANLIAIELKTGEIIWNSNIPAGEEDTSEISNIKNVGPILVSNRLIVSNSNGYNFYISPYTGNVLGYKKLENGSNLSPIVANGQVIMTTNNANIIAYK